MMLVAAKFTEDEPISQDYWAYIAGVEKEEINLLEREFCFSSAFDFFVETSQLMDVADRFKLSDIPGFDIPSRSGKRFESRSYESSTRPEVWKSGTTAANAMEEVSL